jgi:hypothetical protein
MATTPTCGASDAPARRPTSMTNSISALPAPRAIAEFFAIASIASVRHECDTNCLYCWGPETD